MVGLRKWGKDSEPEAGAGLAPGEPPPKGTAVMGGSRAGVRLMGRSLWQEVRLWETCHLGTASTICSQTSACLRWCLLITWDPPEEAWEPPPPPPYFNTEGQGGGKGQSKWARASQWGWGRRPLRKSSYTPTTAQGQSRPLRPGFHEVTAVLPL